MRKWSDSIDPTTIPDDVITSEWARRQAAKRRTFGAGSGRPKVMRPCPTCGLEFSASDLRRHRCKTTAIMQACAEEREACSRLAEKRFADDIGDIQGNRAWVGRVIATAIRHNIEGK